MNRVRFHFKVAFLLILGLAALNYVTILKLLLQPRLDTVKALSVRKNGGIEFRLAGLLLPADEPSTDFMKDAVINPHPYTYIHNPEKLCVNASVNLLVGVVTSPSHFELRRNGRRLCTKDDGIVCVFIIGLSVGKTLQKQVDQEAHSYGDLVQTTIIDTPRNLSLKSVALLKWAATYCSQAQFLLKKDDDVELEPLTILNLLRNKSAQYKHFILGNSKFLIEGPLRQNISKYYTSYSEYGPDFFPIFAHGPAYGFPIATADVLYKVSLRTKLFWLEDVYITGICAHRANIPVLFESRFIYKHIGFDFV